MGFNDNIPAGISECESIGLSGNCGPDCPVLARGDCPARAEFLLQDIKDFKDRMEKILKPIICKKSVNLI